MSVNTIEVKANLVASTSRGPSAAIWADCPVHDIIENPGLGMYVFDDFLVAGNAVMSSAYKNSIGAWQVYGDAGATFVDGIAEGGVVTFGSDGDNEGLTLSSAAGSFRITTTATLALNGKLWFEARVNRSTLTATKGDFFIGLCDNLLSSGIPAAAIPISTTDNVLSTVPNLIGFHSKGNGSTEWNFVYQLAGGTAVYPTGLTTLMNTITGAVLASATQFVKLGFLFDPAAYTKQISSASTGQTAGNLAKPLITVFVNGLPAPAFLTSTNVQGTAFPTGFMSPVMAVMNQTGTVPPTMSVDWIRVAQNANS